MKIPREELLDLLYNDEDVLSDTITGHSCWSVHHTLIFKYKDETLRTTYSVGATESQDESPWDYVRDGVECERVHEVEKTVKVWEVVNA